ncbi:MAG: protein-disulfide reductase DsbD domain-containing protein, partial [Muribaculaceae bacterium]
MRRIFTSAVLLLATFCTALYAQMVDPIQWSHSIEKSSDTEGKLLFSATMEKGWHFYGMQLPEGGPNPTEFVFDQKEGIEFGEPTPSVKATVAMDEVFRLELSWWESDVTFTVSYKVTDETKVNKISGYVSFQGCNDEMCIAPTKVSFSYKINDNVVEDDAEEIATEEGENSAESDIWAPVEIPEGDANSEVSSQPWWYIFLLGFGGGFIALLTPCVWPLIPMTVSFFLKKNSDKSKSIREA